MNQIFENELYFYSDRLRKLLRGEVLEGEKKDKVFHSCHTLKGLCLAAGFKEYAQALHDLEESIIEEDSEMLERSSEKVLDALDNLSMMNIGSGGDVESFVKNFTEKISQKLEKKVTVKFNDQSGNFLQNFGEQSFKKIIIHLIMNSLDHGIEKPRERNVSNKCSFGTISIDLNKDEQNYYLSFKDDGRGIQPQSKKLSLFSGRKKGLDIVHKVIDYCEGKLDIDSEEGEGTKVLCTFPVASFKKLKKVA